MRLPVTYVLFRAVSKLLQTKGEVVDPDTMLPGTCSLSKLKHPAYHSFNFCVFDRRGKSL